MLLRSLSKIMMVKNSSVNFCEGMCQWCDHPLHSTSVLKFAPCCSSLIDLKAVCFIMVHMLYIYIVAACMHLGKCGGIHNIYVTPDIGTCIPPEIRILHDVAKLPILYKSTGYSFGRPWSPMHIRTRFHSIYNQIQPTFEACRSSNYYILSSFVP